MLNIFPLHKAVVSIYCLIDVWGFVWRYCFCCQEFVVSLPGCFWLSIPQEVAVTCYLGLKYMGVWLGLEDVLSSWLNHVYGWQVHASRWWEASDSSWHGAPIGLLVYPLGPRFLQEQLAQRGSKRKPQCIVAGQRGIMSFLPYSVC